MKRFMLCLVTSMAAALGLAGAALAEKPVSIWETKPALMQRNRDHLMSAEFKKIFPRLGTDFWMVAPASSEYNTWSHAIGIRDQWVNVGVGPVESPFQDLDAVMTKAGFRRLNQLDTTFDPKLEKVIVFGKPLPTGQIELTAAVVQHADGTYTAKLGRLGVIGFTILDQLTSPAYGVVMGVYVRPVQELAAE